MRSFVVRTAFGALALVAAAIATLPAQGQQNPGCQLCVGGGVYIMEPVNDPDGVDGGDESTSFCRAPSAFTLEGGCVRLVDNDYLACDTCISCPVEGSEGFMTCERWVDSQNCEGTWLCNPKCCAEPPWLTLLNPPAGCSTARVLYVCDPQ